MNRKSKKNKRITPEEAIRHSAEAEMDMSFDYDRIRGRLDIEEIARVGAVRRTERKNAPALPLGRVRRPATVVTVTVLLTVLTLGAGGILAARFAGTHTPPTEGTEWPPDNPSESHEDTLREEITEDSLQLFPLDTLIWDGVTYTRTNQQVSVTRVGKKLGQVGASETLNGMHIPGRVQDGFAEASMLEGGVAFYAVTGYSNALYIAVASDGGYCLYMVNDAARPELP